MFHAAFSVPICLSAQPGGQQHAWQAPNSTHFSVHGFSQSLRRLLSLGHTEHFTFQPTLTGVPLIGGERGLLFRLISVFIYLEVFCF